MAEDPITTRLRACIWIVVLVLGPITIQHIQAPEGAGDAQMVRRVEVLKEALAQREAQLRTCLGHGVGDVRQLTVRAVISARGQVERLTVTRTPPHVGGAVAECLFARLREEGFPAAGVDPAHVEHTLTTPEPTGHVASVW